MVRCTFYYLLHFISLSITIGIFTSVPPIKVASGSDSKIYGPQYEQIRQDLKSLEEKYSEWVTQINYGISRQGRALSLIKISMKSPQGHTVQRLKKAVYISGATHGYEYLNIEDRLPRHFLENRESLRGLNQFLSEGNTVYIVPIVNPDGYIARTRKNKGKVDLNRDFTIKRENHIAFKEPESRQLAEYLAQDLKENHLQLALTLDYHCCQGALIYPWSFIAEPLSEKDLKSHQDIGSIIQSVLGESYKMGTTTEILRKPRVGTSKDHFYETYHSLSFTFEGMRGIENLNFLKHIEIWDRIFEYLNS